MRRFGMIWSFLLLAATPAAALTISTSVVGPPSGFRQDFLYTFATNSVVSASGTLFGARTDLFYEPQAEELQFNVTEVSGDCTAPGTCVAFASASLATTPNSLRVRIETPRGFFACEPLGSIDGFCGRIIASPELVLQLELAGFGSGTFTRTDSVLTAIPEPAMWASLIAGFGLIGAIARRQRNAGCRITA